MASGSGTTTGVDQLLYAAVLADTRFYIRFTDPNLGRREKFAVLFVTLTSGGQQYLWRSFPVYGFGRIVTGIPDPGAGQSKRFILRPSVPGLDYDWFTAA